MKDYYWWTISRVLQRNVCSVKNMMVGKRPGLLLATSAYYLVGGRGAFVVE